MTRNSSSSGCESKSTTEGGRSGNDSTSKKKAGLQSSSSTSPTPIQDEAATKNVPGSTAGSGKLGLRLDSQHVVLEVMSWSHLYDKIVPGDRILKVDQVALSKLKPTEVVEHLSSMENESIHNVELERQGATNNVVIIPRRGPSEAGYSEEQTSSQKSKQKKLPSSSNTSQSTFIGDDMDASNDLHTVKAVDDLEQEQHDAEGDAANSLMMAASETQQLTEEGSIPSYPVMAEYGVPLGTTELEQGTRQQLLSELINLNEQHGLANKVVQIDGRESNLVRIPCSDSSNGARPPKEDMILEGESQVTRLDHNKDELMNNVLEAFAHFCNGTKDDATGMLLDHFAQSSPAAYLKHAQIAEGLTKKEEKKKPKRQIILPEDYVHYDGSINRDGSRGEPHWNLKYMQLLQYKEKNGHCLVSIRKDESKTGLGRFVSRMRTWYKDNCPLLTPRRKELLEGIGFSWQHDPTRKAFTKGGDPEMNRTMAAKIFFPQLTVREALYLGGYKDEELDVIVNRKHAWRTEYVQKRDVINNKLKKFDSMRDSGAKKEIQKLIDILKGDESDRFDKVFGDQRHLLDQFLQDAKKREQTEMTGCEGNGTNDGRKRARKKVSGTSSPRKRLKRTKEEHQQGVPSSTSDADHLPIPAAKETEQRRPPLDDDGDIDDDFDEAITTSEDPTNPTNVVGTRAGSRTSAATTNQDGGDDAIDPPLDAINRRRAHHSPSADHGMQDGTVEESTSAPASVDPVRLKLGY